MPTRTLFFFILLVGAFGLLGFPDADVPVPDRIGTSRDWEDPANAELFRDVEATRSADLSGTIYTELGKESYGR